MNNLATNHLTTPENYVAYPALERLSLDRSDRRLKPAWLLRYWYLAQHLQGHTAREELFALWALPGTAKNRMRDTLCKGDGLLWDKVGLRVRIYSAAQLHERLGLELAGQPRPYEQLRLPIADLHSLFVAEAQAAVRDCYSGRITHGQLGAHVGLCRTTVGRLLARARA